MQYGEESKGLVAKVKEFERRHPEIEVSVLSMGAGGMNPQKLMTAIVGNVPPDVIQQDRFTIGDWASRDTFLPLDEFVKRDVGKPFAIKEEDYFPACWAEANYTNPLTGTKGLFAVPYSTDDRALFYNKEIFRQAGIVDEKGEPKPPKTWEELQELAVKLTERNSDGTYKRIGFIPNYGNSFLYIYSWQNNGEFMSPDGRTCIMNAKPNVESLEYMVKIYDALGGVDAVSAFQSGFQANELDPFLTGKVAMKIDGSWIPNAIARYNPDLDFGVVPAPVPAARLRREGRFKDAKEDYITWAGGFSFAIPRGAKNPDAAWEFIKWMASPEAAIIDATAQKAYNESKGRAFVPSIWANRKANAKVMEQFAPSIRKFREATELFQGMMDHARFRPVTFVGQRLWDEHVRAFDNATHHKTSGLTPQAAMDDGTRIVQQELDMVFEKGQFKHLNSTLPTVLAGIGFAVLIGLAVGMAWRVARLKRNSRTEAVAGYVFVAPWLIGFIVLTAGPILVSLFLSFCDYDVLHAPRYVGFNNYADLLGRDSYYLKTSLKNALYISMIGIPLGITTSLSVAMLLNSKVSGMSLYRTFFYMPSIVPVVASALLWTWILNGDPNRGLLNAAWKATLGQWLGMKPPGWFGAAEWAKPGLILQGLWGAGSGMILWLAGLQGISQQLYEAADIDGAGWWAKFRNVTLPMLSPYIFFNLIMGTIGALQEFERVYVLAGGDPSRPIGPVDSLLVPVYYLFKNAFQYFKMGYASALAWILFILILLLTVIQLKLAPRWVYYEGERK
jgi:multiple sugar transport system permease protein